MALNPVLVIRPFVVRELKWESAETYTLVISPVDETDAIRFVPGQWVYLYLYNSDGSVWAKAAYSIASAPVDGSSLELGIKIKGDFTKRASNLMPGDRIGIQGPFGLFVLPPGEGPMVFFAAGVGITPFRSMLRQLVADGAQREVAFYYSNRTVEDAPYLEEFLELAKRHAWFKPVFNLTQDKPSVGTWELGRLDGDMISRHLPSDTKDISYLMCGPKGFMDMIKQTLADKGIDVKKRLKQELFG
jgi:ferredoxin-NADP reductase